MVLFIPFYRLFTALTGPFVPRFGISFVSDGVLNATDCCRMLVSCEEWPSSVSGSMSWGKFLVLAPGSKLSHEMLKDAHFDSLFLSKS